MSTRPGEPGLVEPSDTAMAAFVDQFRAPSPPPALPTRRAGVRLLVVQPHPDDAALSIGGTLLQVTNPLTVLTVYARSATARASRKRQAEDRRFAGLVGAGAHHLGRCEGSSLSAPRPWPEVDSIAHGLHLAASGALVLAPAGVARHVDHVAVHEAVASFDTAVFWEDVAFWSIYGASIEDRVQFSLRAAGWLADQVLVGVGISEVVRDKAALLACYRSQSDEVWRPLRYAWAAARELGRSGYCERFFVHQDQLDAHAQALGLRVEPGPRLCYGTVTVDTAWATAGPGR